MNNNDTVLITGATGFIGSNLVKTLVSQGRAVHVIKRQVSSRYFLKDYAGNVSEHIHDGSFGSLLEIVKLAKPVTVFHLASEFIAAHQPSQVNSLITNNVTFPAMLAEAMSLCGVRRLINTGTSWQYFDDTNYRPANLYAATKQAFESLLAYYVDSHNWNVLTLNLFDTYGPGDERLKIIRLLYLSSQNPASIDMSPGHQYIDLVHVDDIIEAYLRAETLLSEGSGIHTRYGVSSGYPITLRQLVAKCEEAWNVELQINWGAKPYRSREVMKPWSTFRKLPGWIPNISLISGLKTL